MKRCEFNGNVGGHHTFVTPNDLHRNNPSEPTWDAQREVFEKTFALWTSILSDGCNSRLDIKLGPSSTTTSSSSSAPLSHSTTPVNSRSASPSPAPSTPEPSTAPSPGNEERLSASGAQSPDPRLKYRPARSKRPTTCGGRIQLKRDPASNRHYIWYVQEYFGF